MIENMPRPPKSGAHAEQLLRLARENPYCIADIAGVYAACGGDIDATELVVRLSLRPVDSRMIAALLDTLRGNQ